MSELREGGKVKANLRERNVPERILRSAYGCIAQKGYANVSLRDIAENAGVALSQLHYYYKNKEGLLLAVVRMATGEYVSGAERRLREAGTPREKWDRFLDYFKGLLRERPEEFRLLFDLVSMSLWNAKLKSLLGGLFLQLSELLKTYVLTESRTSPKFRGVSPDAAARSAVSSVFGTAMQYVLNPRDTTLLESIGCIELPV